MKLSPHQRAKEVSPVRKHRKFKPSRGHTVFPGSLRAHRTSRELHEVALSAVSRPANCLILRLPAPRLLLELWAWLQRAPELYVW